MLFYYLYKAPPPTFDALNQERQYDEMIISKVGQLSHLNEKNTAVSISHIPI